MRLWGQVEVRPITQTSDVLYLNKVSFPVGPTKVPLYVKWNPNIYNIIFENNTVWTIGTMTDLLYILQIKTTKNKEIATKLIVKIKNVTNKNIFK
jgi:hypothetical protein